MIKILYTLKKEFLLITRDIHAVTVLFVMPAVFILIMSLAMHDLFELHGTVNIDVLAVNQDAGKKSETFLKAIEEISAFRFHFIGKDAATESVKEQMLSRDYKFAVIIRENFTAFVDKKGKGKDDKPLELLVNPAVNVQTQLVLKSALEGKLVKLRWDAFIDRIGRLLTVAGIDKKKLKEIEENPIDVNYVYKGGRYLKIPSAVQQSVPAWLVFSMFFIVIPTTVAFNRMFEPREHAFTMLVPRGWFVEGGILRVDPNQAGGTANSIEAKCDISIKSDAAGTVMLRRLPKINYADGPMLPPTHGPGMNYNGSIVTPMPTVDNYLMWLFRQIRPSAYDVKMVQRESLPKLATLMRRLSDPLNRTLMQIGIQPPSYHAGYLIVEYTEDGRRFKELLYTILVDARASMAVWANDLTTVMRSPAEEADRWKPVIDIISNSVKLNSQWVAGELRGQGERAEISRKLMEDIARIDKEIAAHRTRTQQNIQADQYLTITGQNDYRNPYTGKVERDTSDWSRRWVNSSGEYIYSNDTGYNPNADPNNPRHDYKLTQPKR